MPSSPADPGLVARYIAESSQGPGFTFGEPFRFGQPLVFSRSQRPQPPSSGTTDPALLRALAHLDPALQFASQQPQSSYRPQPYITKATVVRAGNVSRFGVDVNHDQEQIPPPERVTISKANTQGAGVTGVQARPPTTGVAVREKQTSRKRPISNTTASYTSDLHTSPDRTLDRTTSSNSRPEDQYLHVVERLHRADVRRRLAALASLSWSNLGDASLEPPMQKMRAQQATALQRIMQAWQDRDQANESGPGPGQYQANNSSNDSSMTSANNSNATRTMGGPAFTMAGRTKSTMPGTSLVSSDAYTVPGPGRYDVVGATGMRPSGPAFTLARKSKPAAVENLPGPGAYKAEGVGLPKGPAFTISGKPSDKVEDLPGPGEYDLKRNINTGPAITIAGRPRCSSPEQQPGPADYLQLSQAGKAAPSFTIYARVQPPKPSEAPAPGDYSLPPAWRTGPSISIGARAQEQGRSRDPSPGPGEYHTVRTSLDGPSYSMAARPVSISPPDSPAPGDYYQHLTSAAPAYSIAGRPQESALVDREAAELPGPGQYNVLQVPKPGSPSAPAYSIGARWSDTPTKSSDIPGPAAYDILPLDAIGNTGPAYTIAGRPVSAEPEELPGPGHYHAPHTRPSGPSYTMGTRPAEPCQAPSPAPGDYEAPASPRGPSYTIPAAPKQTDTEQEPVPGPGEYYVPGSVPSGPAYTIPTTGRVEPRRPDSPAPGDYNTARSSLEGPAYTIATRPQPSPCKDVLPGPGEYHVPDERQGPAFSIRGKLSEPEPENSYVGPGAYNPSDPSLPAPPAYTMKGRPTDPGLEDLPGPGQYVDPPSPRGPAYTMPSGRPTSPGRDELGGDSPGPGAYHVPGDKDRGPAYTIAGKPKETQIQDDELPGPGAYDSPRPDRGPAFTIKGRGADEKLPDTPGPGQYCGPGSPKGPAYTMAGRHQDCNVLGDDVIIDSDIPGPGAYGAPGQDLIGSSGPAYTMRPRHNDGSDFPSDDVPGPGAYATPASPGGPAFSLGGKIQGPGGGVPARGRDVPGPGAYGAPMPPGGAPAFTLGGRISPPRTTAQETPAPGDYGSPGDGGQHGLAFTLGGKRKEADPALHLNGPGPGEHQRVLHHPTGPAYSLGARLRDLLGLKKGANKADGDGCRPEPGQYFTDLGPGGPAYTFGAKTAASGRGPVTPVAPGDYEVSVGPGGPAWTLAAKAPPHKLEMKPGPGQYDHTARPALSSILKTMPQGRKEYAVKHFLYGNVQGSAGVAAGPVPALQRKVSFSEGTQFRDSGEQLPGAMNSTQDPLKKLVAYSMGDRQGGKDQAEGTLDHAAHRMVIEMLAQQAQQVPAAAAVATRTTRSTAKAAGNNTINSTTDATLRGESGGGGVAAGKLLPKKATGPSAGKQAAAVAKAARNIKQVVEVVQSVRDHATSHDTRKPPVAPAGVKYVYKAPKNGASLLAARAAALETDIKVQEEVKNVAKAYIARGLRPDRPSGAGKAASVLKQGPDGPKQDQVNRAVLGSELRDRYLKSDFSFPIRQFSKSKDGAAVAASVPAAEASFAF